MTLYQPKTLKAMAARQTSIQVTNSAVCTLEKVVKFLPMILQVAIAIHLQGEHLVEFIVLHGSLPLLRHHFDDISQFQEFLLHFFLQLENEENSSQTQSYLKKQFLYLKKSIETKMKFELNDSYDFVPVNKIKFDWDVRSLGFTQPILPQQLGQKCLEDDFFALKFGGRANLDQLPIPKIAAFEPKIKTMIENCQDGSQFNTFFLEYPLGPRQRIQNEPFDYENVIDAFFLRLSSVIMCIRKSSLPESLAYIIELLCAPRFQNVLYLKRYELHLWGNLSVILAQINVDPNIVYSCLDNVEQLVRFESDKLDYFRYRQQVSFHLGWTLDENCMFQVLFKSVPASCMIYIQSVQCHVQAVFDCLEDLIMELDICKRVNSMLELDQKEKHAQDLIKKLRIVLHKIFAKTETEFSTCESARFNFSMLDLYEMLVKLVTGNVGIMSQKEVEKLVQRIGLEIEYSDSHLDYFLTHYNNLNQTAFFLSEIDNFKKQFERESNLSENFVFANVFLTNALLLKYLDQDHHNCINFMHEAKSLYEKIQHPRSRLINDFIFCTSQNDRTYSPKCENVAIQKNITVQTILKDQKLCYLVNCGVKNLIRLDTSDYRTFNF